MKEDWRPKDLMIHFYADGGLAGAQQLLMETTGAHTFEVRTWEWYSTICFSLVGTRYYEMEKLGLGLSDDSDQNSAEYFNDETPSTPYNMHLRFAYDPHYEDEYEASLKFCEALSVRTPTLLVDADYDVLYPYPIGGDSIDDTAIPAEQG